MARKTKTTAAEQELNLTGKTALYVRVSTARQAEEGYSLEAQRSKLEGYCVSKGWEVDPEHVYIDAGISGKTTDRPAYQSMLAAVAAGDVRRVVAIKMDRFSRSVRDFLDLLDYCKAHDCAVVSLGESIDTSTPIGRMMITVIAAVAEMEKETIKERLMSGRAQKATEGGHAGGRIEFGYTYAGNDEWTIDEAQADTVRRIFSLFLAGNGLRKIADIVNQENRTTGTGAHWHASTVGYVLRNGAYCGFTQWDGVESKNGKMPAIVTPDDYEAAQLRLAQLQRGNPTFTKVNKPPAGDVVQRVFSEFTHPYNRSSLTEIAKALNVDDVPSVTGGQWSASAVKHLLADAGNVDVVGEDMFSAAAARLARLRPGPTA